jgi:hypothetical protein
MTLKPSGPSADGQPMGRHGRRQREDADPFLRLADVADAIRVSLDQDRSGTSLPPLRRDLDLAFAVVLDEEHDGDRRAEFLSGYCELMQSLDALERAQRAA